MLFQVLMVVNKIISGIHDCHLEANCINRIRADEPKGYTCECKKGKKMNFFKDHISFNFENFSRI